MPESRRKGQAPVDWWTFVHIASGAALAFVIGHWLLALVLLGAYEVVEAGLRRIRLKDGGLFEYESWPNIAADLVLGMAGYVATQSVRNMAAAPA